MATTLEKDYPAEGAGAGRSSDGVVVTPAAGLEAARIRYDWYRDRFRTAAAALLISLTLNVALTGAVAFLYGRVPAPVYFATTQDGQLIRLTPLDQPNLSDAQILQWAVEAVNAANDYNFANYRSSLQTACNTLFTRRGCQSYKEALEQTGNLEAVKQRRLVVTAQVIQAPVLLEYGLRGGVYYWQVQLVALVTSQSSEAKSSQRQVIDLTIVRAPTLEAEHGVQIASYIAQFAGKT